MLAQKTKSTMHIFTQNDDYIFLNPNLTFESEDTSAKSLSRIVMIGCEFVRVVKTQTHFALRWKAVVFTNLAKRKRDVIS